MFGISVYCGLVLPEVEFEPEVLFVNRLEVELPEPEIDEFVLKLPPGVVVEFDWENADVVTEAATKTAHNIVTVKIIPMLIFVLLLLINYNLFKWIYYCC